MDDAVDFGGSGGFESNVGVVAAERGSGLSAETRLGKGGPRVVCSASCWVSFLPLTNERRGAPRTDRVTRMEGLGDSEGRSRSTGRGGLQSFCDFRLGVAGAEIEGNGDALGRVGETGYWAVEAVEETGQGGAVETAPSLGLVSSAGAETASRLERNDASGTVGIDRMPVKCGSGEPGVASTERSNESEDEYRFVP